MEQGKVVDYITNSIVASRNTDYDEIEMLKLFIEAIKLNLDLFKETNDLDLKNNNGFQLNNETINVILNKYIDIDPLIKNTNQSNLSENILQSKVYEKLGVLYVIFDGNTYTMLEMILLGLLTHNTIIFDYNGYMMGSNTLLLNVTESFLEKQNINYHMFQQSLTIKSEEFFKNYKSIDKTIIIGNNEFVDKYLKDCTTDVLPVRYNEYDLYIEDTTHIDLINQILGLDLNINVYIKNGLDINYDDVLVVEDIDEAITNINYSGSKYSSSIFATDSNNASKFLNEVKSNNVFVNTSPTLERSLPIKQDDLLRTKNIILPNIYKFDGSNIKIEL